MYQLQVTKNEDLGATDMKKNASIDVATVNRLSDGKDCFPSVVMMANKDIVSDEAMNLQDVIVEVSSKPFVDTIQDVTEELWNEDNVSMPGDKRKRCDEVDVNCNSDEVSTSQKRARGDDHMYHITSPRRLKRQVDDLLEKNKILKKRLATSQKKARRLKKKVNTLADVVSKLKEENLINNDCAAILETTFSGVPCELMKRLMTQKEKKNPGAYPPELRSFAMTLKFYSAKAYNYVRKSFDLGLPCASVIRSWYSSMDGEPGFTKDAMAALKAKVLAAKRDGQEVVCALMLDEMAIRKHVEWDGKRFRGFVDLFIRPYFYKFCTFFKFFSSNLWTKVLYYLERKSSNLS